MNIENSIFNFLHLTIFHRSNELTIIHIGSQIIDLDEISKHKCTYNTYKSNSLLISLWRSLMVLCIWIYGTKKTDIFYMGVRRNGQMKWYIKFRVFYKRDGVLYNIFCWKDAVNTHTLPRAFYGIDRQLALYVHIYWKWGLNVENF